MREVSSLGTQVKIMWGIGAAIILSVLSGAWGLSSTMSELNRSVGKLQGQIASGSDANKSIADQLKTIIELLKTSNKTGELIPKPIAPSVEIMKGGKIVGVKDAAQLLANWPEDGKQVYMFTPDIGLADEWVKAGALKGIIQMGVPVDAQK